MEYIDILKQDYVNVPDLGIYTSNKPDYHVRMYRGYAYTGLDEFPLWFRQAFVYNTKNLSTQAKDGILYEPSPDKALYIGPTIDAFIYRELDDHLKSVVPELHIYRHLKGAYDLESYTRDLRTKCQVKLSNEHIRVVEKKEFPNLNLSSFEEPIVYYKLGNIELISTDCVALEDGIAFTSTGMAIHDIIGVQYRRTNQKTLYYLKKVDSENETSEDLKRIIDSLS